MGKATFGTKVPSVVDEITVTKYKGPEIMHPAPEPIIMEKIVEVVKEVNVVEYIEIEKNHDKDINEINDVLTAIRQDALCEANSNTVKFAEIDDFKEGMRRDFESYREQVADATKRQRKAIYLICDRLDFQTKVNKALVITIVCACALAIIL